MIVPRVVYLGQQWMARRASMEFCTAQLRHLRKYPRGVECSFATAPYPLQCKKCRMNVHVTEAGSRDGHGRTHEPSGSSKRVLLERP